MITEEIADALETFERNVADKDELERLRAFYDEMKRAGIARTQEYDLPPVDTVGRTAHRNKR